MQHRRLSILTKNPLNDSETVKVKTKKQSTEDRFNPFYSNFYYIFCFLEAIAFPIQILLFGRLCNTDGKQRLCFELGLHVSTWAKNSNVRLKT